MNIIGWILFGLVVGAIAKFLMPGKDPGGWIVTILLGIAGSFVGGFLATTLIGREQAAAGWIGSVVFVCTNCVSHVYEGSARLTSSMMCDQTKRSSSMVRMMLTCRSTESRCASALRFSATTVA